MTTPDEGGVTPWKRIASLVRRGRRDLERQLDGPTFPDALSYLWEWMREIRRGLGAGFEGRNALTWESLDAWARRTRRDPATHEVDALFSLDAVMRNPAIMKESAAA